MANNRKKRQLTQASLAERAGISRATLDALENGRLGELGFSKLSKVLTVLGLEMAIQPFDSHRPTLDEMMEENRAADGAGS